MVNLPQFYLCLIEGIIMQFSGYTLIASAMLLSISTSWASDRDMMNQPRIAPAPEVLPVPIPEPPRHPSQQPAPEVLPIPLPEPAHVAPIIVPKPPPPVATPIPLP